MSLPALDPDDPDPDLDLDLDDVDEFTALYGPPEPDDPLAGYARPATRAPRQIDPRRRVRDLHPL